jgi:hypothetical protein
MSSSDAALEEFGTLRDWLRSHIVNGHVKNVKEIEGLGFAELQALHRQLHEEMGNV